MTRTSTLLAGHVTILTVRSLEFSHVSQTNDTRFFRFNPFSTVRSLKKNVQHLRVLTKYPIQGFYVILFVICVAVLLKRQVTVAIRFHLAAICFLFATATAALLTSSAQRVWEIEVLMNDPGEDYKARGVSNSVQ